MPKLCTSAPRKKFFAIEREREQKILVNKRNKNKYQSNDREEK
jgi:hypothetical protein